MPFSGTLVYEDSPDTFHIHSLELGPDRVQFRGVTTWEGFGLWEIDAVATRTGSRFFTKGAKSRQGVGPLRPCYVEFFTLQQEGRSLRVAGAWSEEGSEYNFSGTLESSL
jgi:hypothetical protein